MKKDASIEIIRILACFLVIMAHIQLEPILNEMVMKGRLLYSSVIADDVPLFFLITGYFLFKGIKKDEDIIPEYIRKIKNVVKKLWIPAVFVMGLSCFLFPWLSGQCELTDIFSTKLDRQWNWLWQFIFSFKAEGTGEHLWYICTYMKIIIWFPLLALLCQKNVGREKIRRLFIGLALANVLLNDMEYLLNRELGDLSGVTFDYYFLYILLGYELALLFEKYADNMRKIRRSALLCYIVGVIVKFGMQYFMYLHYGTNIVARYMWLQCLPCYLTSCGMFCFLHSFRDCIQNRTVCWLGNYTFYIYLFHRLVIYKTYDLGQSILNGTGNGQNLIQTSAYYLAYGLVVFTISLMIAILFDAIYARAKRIGDIL